MLFSVLVAFVMTVSACHRSEDVKPPNLPGERRKVSSQAHAICEEATTELEKVATLSVRRHTPWEILHYLLAFGPDSKTLRGVDGSQIPLVTYFQRGGPYLGRSIFKITDSDVCIKKSGAANEIERHPNQFLAVFAQVDLPLDFEFEVDRYRFSIRDLVNTMCRCYTLGDEGSWTLIALTAYGPASIETTWTNKYGDEIAIRDVLQSELVATDSVACGGSHRLFALAFLLRHRKSELQEHPAILAEIELELQNGIKRAKAMQLADGSFSVQAVGFDETQSKTMSLNNRIYSTGHTLEWLAIALPASELESDWVVSATSWLSMVVIDRRFDPAPASPWCHAIHALQLVCQESKSH